MLTKPSKKRPRNEKNITRNQLHRICKRLLRPRLNFWGWGHLAICRRGFTAITANKIERILVINHKKYLKLLKEEKNGTSKENWNTRKYRS